MIIFICLYYVIVFMLIGANLVKRLNGFYFALKVSASLGFVGIFIFSAVSSGNINALIQFAPAFILYMLGDIFIAIKKPKMLGKALVLFLMGHIAFIVGLSSYSNFKLVDLIIPVLGVALCNYLIKLPQTAVGKTKALVFTYAFFISLFVSKSLSLIFTNINITGSILCFIGSILFFISDIAILFILFYKWNGMPLVFLNLLTYYTGMLLLAVSVAYF